MNAVSNNGERTEERDVEIKDRVAVITGAASGIGHAVAMDMARRGARCIAMVDADDRIPQMAKLVDREVGAPVTHVFNGNVTDDAFRREVFDTMRERYGTPRICVPAAGITRDALAIKMNKDSGKAEIYPIETFRQVIEVNLLAPIYWAMEMVGGIAEERTAEGLKKWRPEERIQGTVIFIGSISSQGNKGQIAYATTKAGLEGAEATLTKEAIYHGVRCGVIHPGFTDTPMVRKLGKEYIAKNILPATQLGRLIRPEEIADAIGFMISNSAVSGELWADAGWHPSAL